MPLVPGLHEGHSGCPLMTSLVTDELGTDHSHRDHRGCLPFLFGLPLPTVLDLGANFTALILSPLFQPPMPTPGSSPLYVHAPPNLGSSGSAQSQPLCLPKLACKLIHHSWLPYTLWFHNSVPYVMG